MKWVAPAVFGCAVLSAAARPTAAEPTCDPVAIVEGDPVLVSSLSAQLIRRGIAIDEAAETEDPCPAVRATVAQDGGAVSVTVTEADGTRVAREVTTTEIAAIWIESRVRRDVGAPLLAVRVPVPAVAPGATAPLTPPPVDGGGVVYRAPGGDRVSVAARIENGSADDGTSWRMYSAAACVKAGPLCVGVLGRLGDNGEAILEEFGTAATRDSRELMLTAAWPLRAGRVTVLPELGVGFGSTRTRQLGFDVIGPDGVPCGADDICAPFDVTTSGSRLSAGLTVAIPLHDKVALDLGVSAVWSPGAHIDPYEHTQLIWQESPDPSMCSDPDMECGEWLPYPTSFPGEPSRLFNLGIGLRVGIP